MSDFYEEDEKPSDVLQAFEAGEQGITKEPGMTDKREATTYQRAYTRALTDLKETYPAQFRMYFDMRQEEAYTEYDENDGQAVFRLGVRQVHLPDIDGEKCVHCGVQWPCRAGRRRLGLSNPSNSAHLPRHVREGDHCAKCRRDWPCKAARRRGETR